MKRLVLATVFAALVAIGVGVSAQGCPLCIVYANVDIPSAATVPVVGSYQPWGVAGWGFLCESGAPTHRVDLWYLGDDAANHPIPSSALTDYWDLNRPDVWLAYVGTCPNVYAQTTGYTVIVAGGAVPPGTRTITINTWVGPYMAQETRTVTFQ